MPSQKDRIITQKIVELQNGYSISLKREKIADVGRSIFRGIADEQFVIEILDREGKTTKRLPIPSSASVEVSEFIRM